jgi:hypothetical protein
LYRDSRGIPPFSPPRRNKDAAPAAAVTALWGRTILRRGRKRPEMNGFFMFSLPVDLQIVGLRRLEPGGNDAEQ